jgi:hypothetical protein
VCCVLVYVWGGGEGGGRAVAGCLALVAEARASLQERSALQWSCMQTAQSGGWQSNPVYYVTLRCCPGGIVSGSPGLLVGGAMASLQERNAMQLSCPQTAQVGERQSHPVRWMLVCNGGPCFCLTGW